MPARRGPAGRAHPSRARGTPIRWAPSGREPARSLPSRAVTPSTSSLSALQARVVVDEWVRGGVREVVACPGSRNAPLLLAVHAADAAGRLRLHVRIDERSAGFLAVGLSACAPAPGPRVVTSGHGGREPAPGGARGLARRGGAGGGERRPAAGAGRHRRQPDRRPGGPVRRRRPGRGRPAARRGTAPRGGRLARRGVPGARGRGRDHHRRPGPRPARHAAARAAGVRLGHRPRPAAGLGLRAARRRALDPRRGARPARRAARPHRPRPDDGRGRARRARAGRPARRACPWWPSRPPRCGAGRCGAGPRLVDAALVGTAPDLLPRPRRACSGARPCTARCPRLLADPRVEVVVVPAAGDGGARPGWTDVAATATRVGALPPPGAWGVDRSLRPRGCAAPTSSWPPPWRRRTTRRAPCRARASPPRWSTPCRPGRCSSSGRRARSVTSPSPRAPRRRRAAGRPRGLRHRRRRVLRHGRGAGPRRPGLRPRRRPDVPPRHQRAAGRADGAPPGARGGGRPRRRRQRVHHPGTGRRPSTPRPSSACSRRRTAPISPPCAGRTGSPTRATTTSTWPPRSRRGAGPGSVSSRSRVDRIARRALTDDLRDLARRALAGAVRARGRTGPDR